MVASGFLMLLLFILATWAVAKRNAENKPWLLKYALFALPLPWIAAQTGWYVAEGGRQPWSIGEILPTHLSASSLSTGDVWGSILALAAFYTILLIIEMYLMIKFARLGQAHFTLVNTILKNKSQKQLLMGGFIMIEYELLKIIWWVLVGVLLIGFALTDGFDMGSMALMPFVGKTDNERRAAINTIAPHWDGNQVWFITAGGALFAAWPMVYSVAFSGMYWALLLVLFALFLRPVGFDYRSKLENTQWRNSWDWGLCIGGAVPALVLVLPSVIYS